MTDYRFSPDDVLGVLLDVDGDFIDDSNAWVHVATNPGAPVVTATVSLTSSEADEFDTTPRVTERFRVTIERFEGGA